MVRCSTKRYFNKTLQQNSPSSVNPIINNWRVQGGQMHACDDVRDSLNQKVLDAGVQTRSGCKWSAMTAVDHAGSMLEIDILSNTCTGRKGIGVAYFHQRVTRRKERAWCKERWINRLKKSEDERLQNSAIREPGYDGSFQKAKIRGRSYGTRTNTELPLPVNNGDWLKVLLASCVEKGHHSLWFIRLLGCTDTNTVQMERRQKRERVGRCGEGKDKEKE